MGRTGQWLKGQSNIEKAQSTKKNAKHKAPLMWETKCGFTIHERTLDRWKLERNWHGPCEIVQHTSRGTYRLHNQHGKLLKQAFISNRLKVYNGQFIVGEKLGQAKKEKAGKQEEPKQGQE